MIGKQYVVNRDGFLVDPETGEVIDELTYRFVSDVHRDENPYEILAIKEIERGARSKPKPDIKKYLLTYLPEKLREEFLSRVDGIKDDAEIFAHFVFLLREYGIILDFSKIREELGLSKITLRTIRKKLMMQGWVKSWERINPIYFKISREIEKKNWLPAILLAIDYERRGMRVSIDELKKHLFDKIDEGMTKSHYLKYLIRNGKYSIPGVYRYFDNDMNEGSSEGDHSKNSIVNDTNSIPRVYRYFVCPHGKIVRIDYKEKQKLFRVAHLDGTECFYVSKKKVMRILSKMELHYEVVRNSTQNGIQLLEKH
jgi:hypothetical protein